MEEPKAELAREVDLDAVTEEDQDADTGRPKNFHKGPGGDISQPSK